eukprot:CAMPEP_0182853608 /NCGR_PEP_ID=MMETSP0034_2-20130328/791_1 /TAXON_ID=156128 /ORGANISM="Nephroselmis pyriformis, Strain CCMP717" /LENGTH=85 /DNA_ID=CAMNT_0024984387 /DNA_START=48 /DNA_END=305 /DNA_ORIENTATION=-
MSGRLGSAGGLDLKNFLMRHHVISLYRGALRTAARAPPHARADLRVTMREEMERNRSSGDLSHIKFLISEGRQRLKELETMFGMK